MAGVSKVELVESKQAMKALKQAPFEILKSYEIWARLVEEHGTRILRDFKGYGDEKLKENGKAFVLPGLIESGACCTDQF